jgi:hypothetical protein
MLPLHEWINVTGLGPDRRSDERLRSGRDRVICVGKVLLHNTFSPQITVPEPTLGGGAAIDPQTPPRLPVLVALFAFGEPKGREMQGQRVAVLHAGMKPLEQLELPDRSKLSGGAEAVRAAAAAGDPAVG